jgi:hypothetical protein
MENWWKFYWNTCFLRDWVGVSGNWMEFWWDLMRFHGILLGFHRTLLEFHLYNRIQEVLLRIEWDSFWHVIGKQCKMISTSYEFLQERGDTALQSHDHVDFDGFWGYMGVPRSWICLKDTKNVKIPHLYWLSPLGKCQVYHRLSQDGRVWPGHIAWIPPRYGCFKLTNRNRKWALKPSTSIVLA